jgi:endonuclease YncB( thermonuclease family)
MKAKVIPSRGTTISGLATLCPDGDGFTLASEIGPVRIRLVWIDAPEMTQSYGGEAKRALWDLIERYTLHAYVKGHDKYGRSLALVMRDDGLVVNLEMIRIGAAHYYARFGHGWPVMMLAESRAKAEGLGLWAFPNAMSPHEWRRSRVGHLRMSVR